MTRDKKENWPKELKYFERLADMSEILFGLNLHAHCKPEVEYSILCLETVDLWLGRFQSSEDYSEKQNLAITLVLKARRLFRAAQFQIFKGYLPEAEITYRSIFEILLVLSYILDDPTDERINKYLKFTKKGVWDFRLLCEDLLGKDSYKIYESLSQYPHPYNSGRAKLIHHKKLQGSAIHDYENAGKMLVNFGNSTVGLCEQSNILFEKDPAWEKKHQEIYDTAIFKKNIKIVNSQITNEEEKITRILSKSEKIQKHYKKK